MSSLPPLTDTEVKYLSPYLPGPSPDTRPHVTLTYATALDGLISISPSFRTVISGRETKSMTHYLRLHHDAILVGVNTALHDDPALNCRYPSVSLDQQPQPVIIDSQLQWDITSKQVVQLCSQGRGKKPWVLYRSGTSIPVGYPESEVELIAIQSATHRLDWETILSALSSRRVRSLMVEGGASILSTLLRRHDLVDSVIVTVAPTWLGNGGESKHVVPGRTQDDGTSNAARLRDVAWQQFGQDMVLCGRLIERPH